MSTGRTSYPTRDRRLKIRNISLPIASTDLPDLFNCQSALPSAPMVSVPSFNTKRLILKPLSLDDIPSYETHFIDYEVIRHLSAVVPWPYPRNGVSEFFQNVLLPPQGISRWSWGLFLNERPTEVIGCLELWRPGTPENRGFWLARKYWGRGLMTEAVLV